MGQEKLTGEYDEHEKVGVIRSTNNLEMNQQLSEELGVTRREVAPIDCGNVHENFIKAQHQNRRIKSTYATTVNLMVAESTGLRLFDKVDLTLASTQTYETNEVYQGSYLITAKTIAVSGAYYREKFELSSQGVNNDALNFRV